MLAREPDAPRTTPQSGYNRFAKEDRQPDPEQLLPGCPVMYPRGVEPGVHRSKNDPHPAMPYFLAIESFLDANPELRAFAIHRYVHNRPVHQFPDGGQLNRLILDNAPAVERSRNQIQQAAQEIRLMMIRKQRERDTQRMADCRDRMAA
jgi:hypothetical protein